MEHAGAVEHGEALLKAGLFLPLCDDRAAAVYIGNLPEIMCFALKLKIAVILIIVDRIDPLDTDSRLLGLSLQKAYVFTA